jgi:hypothetical protein
MTAVARSRMSATSRIASARVAASGVTDGQLSTRAPAKSAHSTTALVRRSTRSKTSTLWWIRSG